MQTKHININHWERSTKTNGINQLTNIGFCYFLTRCQSISKFTQFTMDTVYYYFERCEPYFATVPICTQTSNTLKIALINDIRMKLYSISNINKK